MRRMLRLVLAFACLSASAHAAYQWPDSTPPDQWRTADEACSLGEALPELARLRATNSSRQYTLIWAFANEYTVGESQCRFVIEERRPFITTDLFYDFLHIRAGAADACALAGYLDPETGQCGAPKGAFGPNCPAGANGTNPIHGASGNKYQRELDFEGAGSFPLRFERHYNSRDFTPTALGTGWRHGYAGVLVISDDAGTLSRVRAVRPDGRVLTYTWNGSAWASDADVNVLTRTEQASTDPDGSQGFTATLTGMARVWTHTWNADGQLLTVNGPRTDVSDLTTYAYYTDTTADHRRGDLMRVTNALGQVTNFTRYDGAGRLRESTDPNGVTTVYAYDARGRLGSVTTAGATTALTYDAAGHLGRVTLADASFAAYTYDAAGRLTEVADAAGNRIVHTLDAAGNRVGETWRNPDGSVARSRTRVFDALSRVQQAIGAAGQTTAYAYDAQGNLTSMTDPKAQTTGQAYDARHRLTQLTDALTGLTALGYDHQDRLTGLTAPNGAATAYTYDGLGNLTQEQSPDRGTSAATHDAAGNVLTRTDARGVTVTTTYDALNRPLTETWSSGETVAYTWDAAPGCSLGIGRLCRVQDSAGDTTYAYDAQGRLIAETRTEAGVSLTTTYTLSGAGRLLGTTLPSGENLSLTRDAAGRVSALASASETLAQALAYDAAGALTAQTLGNGVTQTATYDADGQRSAQAHSGGSSGGGETTGDDIPTLGEWGAILLGSVLLLVLVRRSRGPGLAPWLLIVLPGVIGLLPDARASDATYTYDSNGNVLTRSAPDTTTYSYDALDRLTREQGPAITQSFGYDGGGNRTSDGVGSYVYAPNSNRQTSRPQGAVTLDPAGHTTAQAGFSYTWDGAGRLKEVRLSGTLLATYHYDARHRRTRKETTAQAPQGVATVLYAYDQNDHLLAGTDASGPIRSYVWRDATPVAQIEYRPTRNRCGLPVPTSCFYFS